MITCQIVNPVEGHKIEHWDPDKPGDMEKMRKFFKEKIKAGFQAFALFKDGVGKLIREFDEEAERIVLIADKIKMVQPGVGG